MLRCGTDRAPPQTIPKQLMMPRSSLPGKQKRLFLVGRLLQIAIRLEIGKQLFPL